MKISNGRHLTYCTNIHIGENWQETFDNLKVHVPLVKARISPDHPFGIGLRLSNIASKELITNNNLKDFKNWLALNNLYVFTINGFPYGDFHYSIIKDKVHLPDWTTRDRLDYTKRLFNILSELLPIEMDGGISTSPISYSPWHLENPEKVNLTFELAAIHFAEIVCEIILLKRKNGKHLHLDIEPEPDGLIENSLEMINFFNNYLLKNGADFISNKTGISIEESKTAIREHINVCYDVCHFAVGYEKPENVFDSFEKEGIKIGKIQISSALKVILNENPLERKYISEHLKPFVDSPYLHQVVKKSGYGELHRYRDLSIAMKYLEAENQGEWRIHYHVPVFMAKYNKLHSTQEDIISILNILKAKQVTNHLEVETYTWEVLPKEERMVLTDSISRELEWVLNNY